MKNGSKTRNIELRVGVAIHRYRELKGLTESELAEKAGISQPDLLLIERGEHSGLNTLDRVCVALDKKLSDIVKFAENVPEMPVLVKKVEAFIEEHRRKKQMQKRQSA